MNETLESCPSCGKTMMQGAMRCVACGKILQTPEEQIASLERLQTKPEFNMKGLLKGTLTIIVLSALYYYFSDSIADMIKNIAGT